MKLTTLIAVSGVSAFRSNQKQVEISCDGQRDGYLAHPTDCHKFFRCTAGLADKFDCPDGPDGTKLTFQADLESCTFDAACGDEISRIENCKGKFGDGKFAAKEDQQYFTCDTNGNISAIQSCQSFERFDIFQRECVNGTSANHVTRSELLATPQWVDVADTVEKYKKGERSTFIKTGDHVWRPSLPEPVTPRPPANCSAKSDSDSNCITDNRCKWINEPIKCQCYDTTEGANTANAECTIEGPADVGIVLCKTWHGSHYNDCNAASDRCTDYGCFDNDCFDCNCKNSIEYDNDGLCITNQYEEGDR